MPLVNDLRHTAITRMAEAGVPIPVILSMAGHISTRMQQHYTAVSQFAKRRAVQAAFNNGNYMVSGGRVVDSEVQPAHDVRPHVRQTPEIRCMASARRRKVPAGSFDAAD